MNTLKTQQDPAEMMNAPDRTKNARMTKEEKVCLWISFLMILLLISSSGWIRHHCPPWAFTSLAGYYFGTMATFSGITVNSVINKLRKHGLRTLGKTNWARALGALFYLLIALMGFSAWYITSTLGSGFPYAVGAFVGSVLITRGAGAMIQRDA